jgi:capsular polysaccharide export protein
VAQCTSPFIENGNIIMTNLGLNSLRNKNVLLLQGPIGPFFWRLAKDFSEAGANVSKVNFNGGDWLFYPNGAFNFRGRMEDWAKYFVELLDKQHIDVILMFGDCRPIHRIAHQIAQRRGLEIGVFEEGYVRPDYVTLERLGVNNHSLIPREANFYLNSTISATEYPVSMGSTYWHTAMWAALYYFASGLLKKFFLYYQHHRPLNWMEAFPCIRSIWRKWYYAFKEIGIAKQLENAYSGQYFLVPLQVHNDSQIHVHSDFDSVPHFIREVMNSFATHAPPKTVLIIKQHPLDRGYHDYSKFIQKLAAQLGLQQRCCYIHDQHLPTLIQFARGVVVINSTVGLSALHHDTPTKLCGKANYNIVGLTFQGTLDDFWSNAQTAKPDKRLLANFQNYLIRTTQLNGSFYKRLPKATTATGWHWAKLETERCDTESLL